MDEKLRNNLMKLIALTALVAFIYPEFALLRCAIENVHLGYMKILFAVLIIFSGFLAGRFILREKSKTLEKIIGIPLIEFILGKYSTVSFLTKFIAFLTMLLPFGAAMLVYAKDGPIIQLIEAAFALILYIIGLRANFNEFENIINDTGFYIGLIFSVISIFISTYFNNFSQFRIQFAFLAFIGVFFSLVVRNQANLDNMIMKKGAHSASTTKNIRSFNIKILVIFLFIIILMLNLDSIVVFVLETVKLIIKAITKFIFKVLGYLMTDTNEEPIVENSEISIPFYGTYAMQHPIKDLIFNVIKNFILLYGTYKLIPIIIKAIKKIAVWVSELVKRIFVNRVKSENSEIAGEYTDESVIIRPSWLRTKKKNMETTIKKSKNILKNIKDPVQRLRLIYACIIELLIGINFDIKKSDTTGEILEKSIEVKEIHSYLTGITHVYDRIRYGGSIPDYSEVVEADNNFDKISNAVNQLRYNK